MVQFEILTGKMAGACLGVRRFPVRIGRSPETDLRLEASGVWEEHLEIELNSQRAFILRVLPGAIAAINGQPVQEAPLRNGDLIEIGALKLRFWLAAPRQAGWRFREWLTWIGIGTITLAQVGLVYWLSP